MLYVQTADKKMHEVEVPSVKPEVRTEYKNTTHSTCPHGYTYILYTSTMDCSVQQL